MIQYDTESATLADELVLWIAWGGHAGARPLYAPGSWSRAQVFAAAGRLWPFDDLQTCGRYGECPTPDTEIGRIPIVTALPTARAH